MKTIMMYGVNYIICKDGDIKHNIMYDYEYTGLIEIVSLQTKLDVIATTVRLYNRLYDDNLELYEISYKRVPISKSR